MGLENGETVSIDGVIINLHGNPYNIYSSNGKAIDLNRLQEKTMEIMLLLACNAGHLNYSNNVAVQFAEKYVNGFVIAPDGTHYRTQNYGTNILGITFGAYVHNITKGDDTFKKLIEQSDDPTVRGSKGFVMFYRDNGSVTYKILSIHKVKTIWTLIRYNINSAPEPTIGG